MKLKKMKRGLLRGLATGLLVSVSMSLPATLSAAKVEHASIVSVARQGNSEIAPSPASVSSSSHGNENTSSDQVGADRLADLPDETNPGLPVLDSDHRRESLSTTARFDSEMKRSAGRRVAAGTLTGLRILQLVFSNGQNPGEGRGTPYFGNKELRDGQ